MFQLKFFVLPTIVAVLGLVANGAYAAETAVTATASIEKLNFAQAANMGLVDEYGWDNKGGWFDQGPDNDLSGFPTGDAEYVNVPFNVIDPNSNDGRGIIVLAGKDRPNFPQSVTLKVNDANASGYLYLLHSAGWLPSRGTTVGKITFLYTDGSQTVQTVKSGEDIADWFNAYDLENGIVAWTKPARGGRHGIFVSEFRTLPKPVSAIVISSERNAAWAIIGATLSSKAISLPSLAPVELQAGAHWRPFKSSLSVQKGSALDLTNLLDGPAGKYGFVTVRDGHFYFENAPDKRIRFFGTNLCYSSNFPTHAEADRLADDLAATGYNVVRFHHYDGMLTENGKDSVTPDPDRLDKMEYLMAACEKRGMYLIIDLFSYREIRDGEIPEIKGAVRSGFKCLPPVLDSALNNWKTFARTMMTHRNPYNGKTLAENPSLIGICPVNEDPLGTVWHDSPSITEFYNNLFSEWKTKNGVETNGWNDEQAATARFLNEIQIKGDKIYEDYLRNELHVKTPLTGANCLVAISLTEPRANYDYVDNHIYWDHPEFPTAAWKLPYRYHQFSSIESNAFCPRTMFPSRIKGLPFTVTEWNYCNPNRFRAEGPAMMIAYAGLQDWDGLYRFAHSHNIENVKKESSSEGFDLSTDPISQITERVGAIMFLRGDVAPAKGYVTNVVDSANGYRTTSSWGAEGFDEPVELLGLVTGVGSIWAEGRDPASVNGPVTGSSNFSSLPDYVAPDRSLIANLEKNGVIPSGSADLSKGIFKSDTGEILLDSTSGTLAISTERGDWFVSNRPAVLKGANASVDIKDGPTSVAVVALDNKALKDSTHMLVVHVTEQFNTGSKFASSNMKIIESWGKLPHLMRSGQATLTINTSAELKAWALDTKGKRVREVKVSQKDGVLTLILDNTKGAEATLSYELATK